jgi:transposase
MERKERRHHTREFKLEAVRLAAVGDKTKAKVARELGVRVNQLRQWRLDFEEEERNGVPKQELASAEQDLGALRRENARLREENELLKKCMVRPAIARFLTADDDSLHKCIRPLASGLRLQPGHDEIRARRS